ncbi:MAG: hypothetical protein ABI193_00705 [Minicystis sp.]
MDHRAARSIDPELMNLHGALAPDAPFEDLARYAVPARVINPASMPPVAFAHDHDDVLPASPIERAPGRSGRSALTVAAGALAVAASTFALVCAARLPLTRSHVLSPQAAVASLDATPALAPAIVAPAPLAAPESAPREEKIIALPAVTVLGALEGAPSVEPAVAAKPDPAPAREARSLPIDAISQNLPAAVEPPAALVQLPVEPPAALVQPPVEMDRAAAATAIAAAARSAAHCLSAEDGTSTMPTRVTFSPSGRVTSAVIEGGSFVGTSVGGCIATALRSAHVEAFQGSPVAVSMTIRVR